MIHPEVAGMLEAEVDALKEALAAERGLKDLIQAALSDVSATLATTAKERDSWKTNCERAQTHLSSMAVERDSWRGMFEDSQQLNKLLERWLSEAQTRGGTSLLRGANETLPPKCYCQPGKCMAPRPRWCRDHEKRDTAIVEREKP